MAFASITPESPICKHEPGRLLNPAAVLPREGGVVCSPASFRRIALEMGQENRLEVNTYRKPDLHFARIRHGGLSCKR